MNYRFWKLVIAEWLLPIRYYRLPTDKYNVLIISGPGCYSALHFVSGIGSTQRQVHNGIGIRKDVLLYRDYHENETNFYELTKLQENHNY